MITAEELCKSYGPVTALDRVSFQVRSGQTTVVAGADGAGKSTIFKMLLGLVKKDRGRILLEGKEVGRNFAAVTSICGYMPERFSLYMDLSVEENMNFFADIYGVTRAKREERKRVLLQKTGMIDFKNRRAGALSGGMKQKLALSTILLAAPKLIILDEPTTGVDPLSRIEFFNIIKDLKAEGKTILMSTPYLDEAEQGDAVIFLKNGRIIEQDTMTELKRKFPARLFRILPKGNIFEVLEELEKRPELKDKFYIRGRYIKYLQEGDTDYSHLVPSVAKAEESPRLEDIYLYYERKNG